MKVPFRHGSPEERTRGQAMVEFALMVPILLLLLVLAIDFGRIFFGWVGLQNAARIGADYVARTAGAWDGLPSSGAEDRARYVDRVEQDIAAINCDLVGGAVPDPTFEDSPVDPSSPDGTYDDGDRAVVEFECDFSLITPLANAVLGGPIRMTAHEEFAIHGVIQAGTPSAPPQPSSCLAGEGEVPDMVGERMRDAIDMWTHAGFRAANYSPPVASSNENQDVLTQSLTAGDCEPEGESVTVTHT